MEDLGGIEHAGSATATGASAPALPVFGHEGFTGITRLKLPANGRIALPAHLKGAFADSAKILPIGRRFLNLYTPAGFIAMANDAGSSATAKAVVDPRVRKRLHILAATVSVDSQSRLVLPPEMRDLVGIAPGEDIVLAGAIEAVEIWPARRFDEEEGGILDDIELLLGNYEGLPE
ncbi:MAG: hypothetical protein KF906_04860 [Actinobacteria bacterium]|nr:hypothetical protein [Actinomycetota bacterium]